MSWFVCVCVCVQVEELGLEGEILPVTYSHVASKNRYLYVNKQLHKMPSGIRYNFLHGDTVGSPCQ